MFQQIFVNTTDGSLAYDSAHGTLISPTNDITTGFSFSEIDSTHGTFAFNPIPYQGFAGFYACPSGDLGVYKIYASEGAQCYVLNILAYPYTAGLTAAFAY